ncbi:MAG: B12-binding domain-containing radical SAM protein [Deltaproteobacteria bacterium]|nr:B12-binding domain-containing radical SAM protein [Deltaproteobacteria bacterium]
MKVALVFPRFRYPSGDPPLGLGYLASAIQDKPGVHVDILDTTFESDPIRFLAETFRKAQYDIVGISLMSSMVSAGKIVALLAKRARHDCKVVIGGPHPSVCPKDTLADENVDAICIAEGEKSFSDLIDNYPRFEGLSGIWFKSGKEIVKGNPVRPVSDIDSFSPPAWHLFSMQTYLRNWFQMDSVAAAGPGTSVMASRGCPNNCTFCQPTLRKLFGPVLRKRSPESIAEEIASLVRDFGLRSFMFQDDTFTIDPVWAVAVAQAVHTKNPQVIWACNVHANTVTGELLEELHGYGLRKINMGIESASQRILDEVYNKKTTVEQVKQAVKLAKQIDLVVQGYFMLGAPGETLDEINQTIRLACKLPIDDATFSITTPLPGTILFNQTCQMIGQNPIDYDYYAKPVYLSGNVLLPATLKSLKKKAYLKFYLSPNRWKNLARHLFLSGEPAKVLAKLRRLY